MNDEITERYKALFTEIVAKQAVILGPEIATLKARSIPGLKVSDGGAVLSFSGKPEEVLEELIESYVSLSGQIVKSALTSVFAKYPEIQKVENK